jgi:hypothetical protein
MTSVPVSAVVHEKLLKIATMGIMYKLVYHKAQEKSRERENVHALLTIGSLRQNALDILI